MKPLNLTLFLLLMLIAAAAVCSADGPAEVPMMRHPADDRPQLPDYLPDKPGKGLTLPPAPSAPGTIAGAQTFELKGVTFKGNTVISEEELLKVADTFVGKQVGIADLEELRYRVTRLYVDRGYINSGAVLAPDQTVDNGIVSYLIREGHLDGISITGNGRLKKGYIKKRIWSGKEKPFNVTDLQDRFQLLLQNPLIGKMNGRIRPGMLPGQAFLDLDVVRTRPYGVTITADNHRTPSTGAEGLTAAGTVWNLTGLGDRLDTSLGFSEGVNEFAARFTLPLDAQDTRVSLGFSINDNAVIEEPLDSVDIESDLKNIEINLTHPFVKTLEKSFEMGVTLARRESQTLLDGHRYPFEICSENGKSEVTALRFIQSYVERTPFMAMTLRSTISFGVDIFNPTIHSDDCADGRFTAWLVQTQYARRIGDKWGQFILRGDFQMSDDNLLSLEQFASGGIHSVRGYRENERVRDIGYFFSAEWRYPLWKKRGDETRGSLQAALFTDFGNAWDKGESHENPLHCVGIGLLWKINRFAAAELYLAQDLENAAEKMDHDLQDDGVYFRFSINLFPEKG